jgi:capsid protein
MPLRLPKALEPALARLGLTISRAGAMPTAQTLTPPPSGFGGDAVTFGNGSSGYRTRSTASMTDLRDPRPIERRDAIRNARFLRAKLGVVRALVEGTARHTLGGGLMPKSYCADEEWAKEADSDFLEWASRKQFDIRDGMNFFRAQKVVFPDVQTDGDAGAVPVRDLDGNPRVQHFPGDLISDAPGASVFIGEGSGARWRDGILRSSVGTPIAYRVMREPVQRPVLNGARAYWDYPAANFWLVQRPDRLNANRALPWLYHGDQAAVNILDLNVLEMQAAKLNSYFAAAIKTGESGDLPSGIQEMLEREMQTVPDGTDEDGQPKTKEVERSYLNLMGGAGIPVLDPGEELQFFRNERPSTTFAGFIEYLIADIAIGYGVPSQFVWGLVGLGGPTARLVLQQADWFFADCADVMVSTYCQPIWESYIADRMNRGLLRPPAPGSNWRAVQWQGPGSMTIDKGRDGKLYLDLVKNGMGTRGAWFEMTGKNGPAELKRVVREVREIIELCAAEGVPVEYVLGDQAAKLAAGATDPEEMAEQILERMKAS